MQWFVDGLAWNAERTGMETELVLVEWNPPPDRPGLAEILSWPSPGHPLRTRIITVPAEHHQRLVGDGGSPMMQMIAKNVGVRRAGGQMVLATNIDILLAPSLFDRCGDSYPPRSLVRADRHDVEFPFAKDVQTLPEALRFCEAHVVRVNRRDGIYYPGAGRRLPTFQGPRDFLRWEASRVADRVRKGVGHGDSINEGSPALPPPPPRHLPGHLSPGLARYGYDRILAIADLVVLPKLHANACGDFTMLAGTDWSELRGYPEWIVHSLHLDTLFLHQAHAAGMDFVDLVPPAIAFHMEHNIGSGWSPEGQTAHLENVARRGMETISSRRLRAEKRALLRARVSGKPAIYNGEGWGLADLDLPEWRP
jgi:hypothetical protein